MPTRWRHGPAGHHPHPGLGAQGFHPWRGGVATAGTSTTSMLRAACRPELRSTATWVAPENPPVTKCITRMAALAASLGKPKPQCPARTTSPAFRRYTVLQ